MKTTTLIHTSVKSARTTALFQGDHARATQGGLGADEESHIVRDRIRGDGDGFDGGVWLGVRRDEVGAVQEVGRGRKVGGGGDGARRRAGSAATEWVVAAAIAKCY